MNGGAVLGGGGTTVLKLFLIKLLIVLYVLKLKYYIAKNMELSFKKI